MSQVTIFLDDESEKAAREAAAGAQLSLSCWFAQLAHRERERERERGKARSQWGSFFAELDAVKDDDWASYPAHGASVLAPPRNTH